MSEHRYGIGELAPDLLRAGIGAALTLGPVMLMNPSIWMVYTLLGLSVPFVLLAARSLLRRRLRIAVDPAGVTASGFRKNRIAWKDLREVSLRYYSARRDRSEGWMQLTLAGQGTSIQADSTISGFAALVTAAMAAAASQGLALSGTTMANYAALEGDGARRGKH